VKGVFRGVEMIGAGAGCCWLKAGGRCALSRERQRYIAPWERQFKLSWLEASPPNRLDDKEDSDQ
jgi:hypothetical protein